MRDQTFSGRARLQDAVELTDFAAVFREQRPARQILIASAMVEEQHPFFSLVQLDDLRVCRGVQERAAALACP